VASPGTDFSGTNWTVATSGTTIDISGQSSGTSMRMAAVISGDAELDSWALIWQ